VPLKDPLQVVQKATAIFEKLGVDYCVGGSVASSLYGVPRATQDVDIVADLNEQNLKIALPLLIECFFVDEEMAKNAVKSGSSFNIIDKEFIYKIDIFVQGSDDLSHQEMLRRKEFRLADSEGQSMYLCSPEDIIAHKLYWYKLGNEISERQWNDAKNVVNVQQRQLDFDYLKKMCKARGVSDLLERLLRFDLV
jgi:hypothetical protein